MNGYIGLCDYIEKLVAISDIIDIRCRNVGYYCYSSLELSCVSNILIRGCRSVSAKWNSVRACAQHPFTLISRDSGTLRVFWLDGPVRSRRLTVRRCDGWYCFFLTRPT